MVNADITLATGSVSGTWSNAISGDAGTLEGEVLTPPNPYEGAYSGVFGGDDSGMWSLNIFADGYVDGSITSNSGGTGSFYGGCHPDGFVLITGEAQDGTGFALFGQISGSDINGSWVAEDGSGGTIGPGSISGGGGGGDGGGGGGCFILSLIK